MSNNPHTIRINPKTERELHEFFQEKGFKNGVKFLFDFYKRNQNLVQNIVSELKKEIEFSKPVGQTTTQPKHIQEVAKEFVIDDEADDMLSNLIK